MPDQQNFSKINEKRNYRGIFHITVHIPCILNPDFIRKIGKSVETGIVSNLCRDGNR